MRFLNSTLPLVIVLCIGCGKSEPQAEVPTLLVVQGNTVALYSTNANGVVGQAIARKAIDETAILPQSLGMELNSMCNLSGGTPGVLIVPPLPIEPTAPNPSSSNTPVPKLSSRTFLNEARKNAVVDLRDVNGAPLATPDPRLVKFTIDTLAFLFSAPPEWLNGCVVAPGDGSASGSAASGSDGISGGSGSGGSPSGGSGSGSGGGAEAILTCTKAKRQMSTEFYACLGFSPRDTDIPWDGRIPSHSEPCAPYEEKLKSCYKTAVPEECRAENSLTRGQLCLSGSNSSTGNRMSTCRCTPSIQ